MIPNEGTRLSASLAGNRRRLGPKGAMLAFRDNLFSNPEGLTGHSAQPSTRGTLRRWLAV
jgi:hypothetical protein